MITKYNSTGSRNFKTAYQFDAGGRPFDIPIDDKEAAKLLVPAVPYPGLQWLLAWHSSGYTFYAYSCTTRSQVYVGEVESEHYAHLPYTFYHMLVHH